MASLMYVWVVGFFAFFVSMGFAAVAIVSLILIKDVKLWKVDCKRRREYRFAL